MWHVSSRSDVATLQTVIYSTCYLLTYTGLFARSLLILAAASVWADAPTGHAKPAGREYLVNLSHDLFKNCLFGPTRKKVRHSCTRLLLYTFCHRCSQYNKGRSGNGTKQETTTDLKNWSQGKNFAAVWSTDLWHNVPHSTRQWSMTTCKDSRFCTSDINITSWRQIINLSPKRTNSQYKLSK